MNNLGQSQSTNHGNDKEYSGPEQQMLAELDEILISHPTVTDDAVLSLEALDELTKQLEAIEFGVGPVISTQAAAGWSSPPPDKTALLDQMKATAKALKQDAYRNGNTARENKKRLRKEYAKKISDEHGRDVNNYQKATPKRAAEQAAARQKTARAKLTTTEQSEARKARRYAAKERAKAAALAERTIF